MDQKAPVPNDSEVQVEAYDRPDRPAHAQTTRPATPPPPLTPETRQQRPRRRRSRWFIWPIGCILVIFLVALLACALVGGLIMGVALKVSNEVTASSSSTQSFTVSGTPDLDIRNASGRVEVRQGAPGMVTVEITKNTRDVSQSVAQANLDKIGVTVTQTGDLITITTDFQDANFFTSSRTVNLLISAPPSANITADVTAGDIELNDVSGLMEITGGAGDIALRNVALTDGSRIHVASGSVTMQGAMQVNATIDITASTGDVTLQLPVETQTQLDARTNNGSIHINGWPLQPRRLNTGGAAVNGALGDQPTGTIHVRVDTGDITISQL